MAGLNNPNLIPQVVDLGGLFLSTTGGGVFYVGSTSQLAALGQIGPSIAGRTYTSINAALLDTVGGRSDVIYVLPGYTETVGAADAWSNLGTKTDVSIIGMGRGRNRPTITWSVAGSTVLMDAANFTISNMILQLEPTTGTVTVTAPITVTAAGCSITNCRINTGTDANNKVSIGVTVTTGGDDFTFDGNFVKGAAAATCVTFLRLTAVDNPVVTNNRITCGTTAAAVGPVQELTTVCTNIFIDSNWIHNNAASSTACITAALASTTGWITNNKCRNMTDANNAQIVVTSGDVQLDNNKGVNNSNETAILLGTASA